MPHVVAGPQNFDRSVRERLSGILSSQYDTGTLDQHVGRGLLRIGDADRAGVSRSDEAGNRDGGKQEVAHGGGCHETAYHQANEDRSMLLW